MNTKMRRGLLFLLPAFLITFDQVTKKIIVNNIAVNDFIGISLLNDFLRIIHVKNLGVAFSWGDSVPDIVRIILFIIIPLIVMSGLSVYIVKSEEVTSFQRVCLAGILGGGIGNLIDRIFRSDGVVDFISVKFFGIFGWDRFPTFNVADSSIVVFGILILITFIIEGSKKDEQKA